MKPFKKMNVVSKYTPKISRMEQHIEENPNDYQTKISLAKLYSTEYEHVKKLRSNMMKREVAKFIKEQELAYEKHE